MAIDIDDIDEVAASLTHEGVQIGSVFRVPYGRAARFEDPEGNILQLHQPDGAP